MIWKCVEFSNINEISLYEKYHISLKSIIIEFAAPNIKLDTWLRFDIQIFLLKNTFYRLLTHSIQCQVIAQLKTYRKMIYGLF